ncbi:MAG: hypothetical protein R3E66_07670 [bacterium]
MPDNDTKRPQASEIDEELIDLADENTPSILRPILMIGVIATALWIVSDWREEVSYFFSSNDPIAIGDVTDFASKAEDPAWKPDLPHNRLVSLSGIPTQRSQSARYMYSRLVGGWVFVESKRDLPDGIAAGMEDTPTGDVDRTFYQGTGRLLSFSQAAQRYNGLRDYYRSRYGIEFCETLRPEDIQRIEQKRRDVIVSQWKAEYDEASAEERTEKKLSERPTDAQIKEILDNNPVCVDAYLVQDGVMPRDMIWYLVATVLFVGFMLFNVFGLIRWIRQFTR